MTGLQTPPYPRVLVALAALAAAAAPLIAAPTHQAQATTAIPAPVNMYDVAYTPDGLYAYAVGYVGGNPGKLYKITLADNSMVEVLSGLDLANGAEVAVTPDGQRIAVGGYAKVYLIDPTNPSTDDSWVDGGWGHIGEVAVSNNAVYAMDGQWGKLLRITKGGGGWPAASTGTVIWNGAGSQLYTEGLTVSADDSVLLMTSTVSDIRRFADPLTCGPCTPTTIAGSANGAGIDISPDATFAYYALYNSTSQRRLDLATEAVTTIVGDSGSGSRDAEISADGAYAYLIYTGAHARNPSIRKVRTSDNTVVATVDTPVLPCNADPRDVATSPVDETFLVAGIGFNDFSCPALGGAVYRFPTTAEPPTSLTASSGDAQATITFTAGADGLAAITNYEYSLNGTTWTALSPADSTSPVTITGLANGTTASISLRAVNGVGSSTPSASVSVTPAGPPGAPTVTAIDWDDTTASIYFTPPASDGGSAITTYEYSLDAGSNWNNRTDGGGTASPLVVTGLTTNTTYSIEVRALNGVGGGSTPPAPVIVTPGAPHTPAAPPPTYAPDAPVDVAAEAGVRQAAVQWSAPSKAGSFAITHYQVVASPGGSMCLTTTTSCTVEELTPGEAYTFTVRALNGAGWGTSSEPSAPIVIEQPARATIVISGGRTGVKRIEIAGTLHGSIAGDLRPRIEFDGIQGVVMGRSVSVDSDGSFTWGRRMTRAATITFVSGDVTSNSLQMPRSR